MKETMLETHFNNIEQLLLAYSKIAAESGHPVNKGTAREVFVKEFLSEHLCENVRFGSGEIIDYKSEAGDKRNQIDIIIAKDNYPKVVLSFGVNCYLVESVISTMEVKSKLVKKEFFKSLDAIKNTKELVSHIKTSENIESHVPPGIFSVIVAYDGPQKMNTVLSWINEYCKKNEIDIPEMLPKKSERCKVASPIVDMIVVLGKGIIQFDNSMLSPFDPWREKRSDGKWLISDEENGNLLVLFLQLTYFISHIPTNKLKISSYSERMFEKRDLRLE